MERPEVKDEILLAAIEALTVGLGQKIEKHGRGAYLSNHESLGIITEEYHELIDAVRQNDPVDIASELKDVAVACLFALASMLEKEARLKDGQEQLQKELAELQSSV